MENSVKFFVWESGENGHPVTKFLNLVQKRKTGPSDRKSERILVCERAEIRFPCYEVPGIFFVSSTCPSSFFLLFLLLSFFFGVYVRLWFQGYRLHKIDSRLEKIVFSKFGRFEKKKIFSIIKLC